MQRSRSHTLSESDLLTTDSNRITQDREEREALEAEVSRLIPDIRLMMTREEDTCSTYSYNSSGDSLDSLSLPRNSFARTLSLIDEGLPWDNEFCRCNSHTALEQEELDDVLPFHEIPEVKKNSITEQHLGNSPKNFFHIFG